MGGISGFGVTFTIGGVAVGEITGVTPPGLSRDTIDVTTNSSPEGWREFVGGLKDGGEASIEGRYKPGDAGQAALRDAFNDDDPSPIVITFPDGAAFSANALVTNNEMSAPFDADITFSATLKVSGKPTFTDASGS